MIPLSPSAPRVKARLMPTRESRKKRPPRNRIVGIPMVTTERPPRSRNTASAEGRGAGLVRGLSARGSRGEGRLVEGEHRLHGVGHVVLKAPRIQVLEVVQGRVVSSDVTDEREVQARDSEPAPDGEVGVVGHPPIHLHGDRARARARDDIGQGLHEGGVAWPRLEHPTRPARPSGLQVDHRADIRGPGVMLRERRRPQQARLLCVIDEEDHVAPRPAPCLEGPRDLQEGSDPGEVITDAGPGPHRVVVRHAQDGGARGPLLRPVPGRRVRMFFVDPARLQSPTTVTRSETSGVKPIRRHSSRMRSRQRAFAAVPTGRGCGAAPPSSRAMRSRRAPARPPDATSAGASSGSAGGGAPSQTAVAPAVSQIRSAPHARKPSVRSRPRSLCQFVHTPESATQPPASHPRPGADPPIGRLGCAH